MIGVGAAAAARADLGWQALLAQQPDAFDLADHRAEETARC